MTIERRASAGKLVAAAALLAAITTSGLLRSFHASTPRFAFLPSPVASLLFALVVLLSLLHLAQRRRRLDLLEGGSATAGLTMAQLVPILLALLGEKWIATEVLVDAYGWIDHEIASPAAADATYRLFTGLGLLTAALCLLPVLRQSRPRLAHYAAGHRLTAALALLAPGVAAAFAAGAGLALAGGGLRVETPDLAPGVLALAAGAQVTRGIAEELLYRGLLQTTLVQLLLRLGLPEGRLPRLLAIVAISGGFMLEHADPAVFPWTGWRQLVFVFAMSSILGTLLEVSRNLYLTMLVHTLLNLLLAGLAPLPAVDGGRAVPPVFLGAVMVSVVFAGIVISNGRRRRA
jgi:membrane protease YdiL (CAAX protease family)